MRSREKNSLNTGKGIFLGSFSGEIIEYNLYKGRKLGKSGCGAFLTEKIWAWEVFWSRLVWKVLQDCSGCYFSGFHSIFHFSDSATSSWQWFTTWRTRSLQAVVKNPSKSKFPTESSPRPSPSTGSGLWLAPKSAITTREKSRRPNLSRKKPRRCVTPGSMRTARWTISSGTRRTMPAARVWKNRPNWTWAVSCLTRDVVM